MRRFGRIYLSLLSGVVCLTMPCLAQKGRHSSVLPSVPVPLRLEVLPASVRLEGAQTTQSLLVTALYSDGMRRDVTDRVQYRSSAPKIASVSTAGEIVPQSDGQAAVAVRLGSLQARISVQVHDARAPLDPLFVNDVVPVLSRLGCNSGTCHGAAQGKGGFRLSLRGYAPEMDYLSITRQMNGRRITREEPERSLFLRKPLYEVTHRGGRRLDKNSREYALLLAWLRRGAAGPSGKEPVLTRLDLLPGDRLLAPKQTQSLRVRATFSDGHTEDVTRRALYASNDVATATVDAAGLVTMLRPGETAITARYMDWIVPIRFYAPYPQTVSPAAFKARNNFIDDYVNAKLKQLHIEPSGLCTDEEFLRRAYVDVLGTLPTAEEARAFLDDRSTNKRAGLVDALLQRPEYGMVWGLKFGDLFVLRREYMGRKNTALLQQWLTEQFNANRPWDKLVTDILTATGDLDENRGGLFFVSRTPKKDNERFWIRRPEATAEMVAQVFLGNRIQCAKCHNHPTEKTTQDDYYRFTALWQQVTGKEGRGELPTVLSGTGNGDVRHPRTNAIMPPQPFDHTMLTFAKDEDRRIKAARWIVAQDDFARNIVNRLWARCFGSGIIEPVDDLRSTNPAKNEPLMRALCDDLKAHHFDLKYLLATILKSRTYQLSAQPNRTNRVDTRLFSHYMARRLPAEEMADALAQVTGVPDRYQGLSVGTRALELADTEIPSVLLDTFGRPPRVQPSDTERSCNPAISQALALLNSAALQEKLKANDGILAALLKSGKPDAEILETLFLRSLARRPTPAESRRLLELVAQTPKRDEAWQDVLWALLNSKEFLFNH